MWQRPKSQAPSEGPWFTNAPLGVNTLGNKMKTISEKAGWSLIYTKHSLRATTVTVLDEAGVAGRDIMAVTGHKSESSLKHYVRTSNAKKQDMSTIISSQIQENVPVAIGRKLLKVFSTI
jgi:site-specific recombinase XerD